MKKILCILLATTSLSAFAISKDCVSINNEQSQNKIAQKVESKGFKSLTIKYSADLSTQANAIQTKFQTKGIKVSMEQVSGTEKCKITNFSKK